MEVEASCWGVNWKGLSKTDFRLLLCSCFDFDDFNSSPRPPLPLPFMLFTKLRGLDAEEEREEAVEPEPETEGDPPVSDMVVAEVALDSMVSLEDETWEELEPESSRPVSIAGLRISRSMSES